jgi:glycosyltransferase involved in cell wall biosynthesis
MEQQLRQKVSELGLDQVVSFTGYQTNIPEWMCKWDMFCLPSFFENHSISILEAMRGGKAIVTTRVGGNEESVTDGKEALIVPARDSDALSDAILRLVEDKELCRNLGKNARRRFLGEFTEEIMKKNLSCALKLNEE